MKYLKTTLPILLALGLSTTIVPAHADWFWEDDTYYSDYDYGYWESDNYLYDDYGAYDADFGWYTYDDDFDTWYGDYDDDYYAYEFYDDDDWFDWI